MNKEDKELLLKDLCTRLPYKCRAFYEYVDELNGKTYGYGCNLNTWCIDELEANKAVIKPYLRSMSSMTEEEAKEYNDLCFCNTPYPGIAEDAVAKFMDWLNEHHFDYRGLIQMGLAIEVTKENNPYKE